MGGRSRLCWGDVQGDTFWLEGPVRGGSCKGGNGYGRFLECKREGTGW